MEPVYSNLEQVIADNSYKAVAIASGLLLLLALVSLLIKHPNAKLKMLLFGAIILVTIGCTIFLAGSTIYLNAISVSGGPVHYHGDYEVWACGKEYELVDPTGWSNKIGSPTLHEHNDKRIHLEGVVVHENDASLGKFFKVTDGNLTSNELTFPTTQGVKTFKTGDKCPDGIPATLQVFVYKVIDQIAVQTKVSNPADYDISPHSQVPPGDCIIVEFSPKKDRTDHMCRSFIVAKEIGKLK